MRAEIYFRSALKKATFSFIFEEWINGHFNEWPCFKLKIPLCTKSKCYYHSFTHPQHKPVVLEIAAFIPLQNIFEPYQISCSHCLYSLEAYLPKFQRWVHFVLEWYWKKLLGNFSLFVSHTLNHDGISNSKNTFYLIKEITCRNISKVIHKYRSLGQISLNFLFFTSRLEKQHFFLTFKDGWMWGNLKHEK